MPVSKKKRSRQKRLREEAENGEKLPTLTTASSSKRAKKKHLKRMKKKVAAAAHLAYLESNTRTGLRIHNIASSAAEGQNQKKSKKQEGLAFFEHPEESSVLLKVLKTTGEERKANTAAFLRDLRTSEKSKRKKTKVAIIVNRAHQARQLQRMLDVQAAKPRTTRIGMKKQRKWTFNKVEWLAKHLTEEERKEGIDNFKRGRAHTIILSDEYLEKILFISHTVGVLVHFDFPESLDQYKVRREAATGAATAIVGDGGIGRPPPTNPSSAPKSEAGEEKASTTTERRRVIVLLHDEAKDSKVLLQSIQDEEAGQSEEEMESPED
mmetsp:Transcript_24216/g.33583  ORF Transcript_24216/g.33583 Transcript_24216/m.33583 type:complete len:323 (+) Transcript_24216:134-1102(+)